MSRYVPRGGEQVFAPPFLQKDTRLRGYLLPADLQAQQHTVDRYLNEPGDGQVRYRAMLPYVLLADAPIASTQSTGPPDHDKGWTPETDVAFWMLVGAGKQGDNGWELQRLAWFLPYVWVDVPTTMATGRELYGYPKELGWLERPQNGDDSLVLELSTLVLPTYSPETELVHRPMLRIERAGFGDTGSHWEGPYHAIRDLWNALGDVEVTWEFFLELAQMLWYRQVPMVFLKQFRDAVEPLRPCYQAILESPARVEGLPVGWPMLGAFNITLYNYASHPVASDLGLGEPGEDGKLHLSARFAFEVHFDFRVELAEIVHERGPPAR